MYNPSADYGPTKRLLVVSSQEQAKLTHKLFPECFTVSVGGVMTGYRFHEIIVISLPGFMSAADHTFIQEVLPMKLLPGGKIYKLC